MRAVGKFMKIEIELMGVLKGKTSGEKREVEVGEGMSVPALIRRLAKSHCGGTNILSDNIPGLNSSLLILVNDREIGVLDGFGTRLRDGDKVTLIPVSHGG